MSQDTPSVPDAASVQDDLAYMRGLAQGSGNGFLRPFGEAYFASGLCYGVQMLLHGAQLGLGWFQSPLQALAVGFGPTIIVLVLIAWLNLQRRGLATNTVGKAIGAVFSAVGLTNLVLALIIGARAWREQSLEIWLIFPCVVMAFQGMAWQVAAVLRRRGWMGLVAVGWFATAIGMGFAIGHQIAYITILGVGLLLFMLIPGVVMMRIAKA